MRNEQLNVDLNKRKIENELYRSSGIAFQNYATVILRSAYNNFRCTRVTKDLGIDGYFQSGTKDTVNKFFSIYGPEKNVTSTHMRKLFSDFNKLNDYAINRGYRFKEWHVVLNFEIIEGFEKDLMELCKAFKVKLKIYTPRDLIFLIKDEEQLFHVQSYILGIDKPFEQYSDFHYHVFLEYFLSSLNAYFGRTTTEKVDFIKKWEKEVCRYDGNDKKITLDHAYRKLLYKKIPEHLNHVFIYLPSQNKFMKQHINTYIVQQEDFLFFENNVWENRHGNICVYAENLFLIYGFIKQMANDLHDGIDSTLKSFMENKVKEYGGKVSPLINVW